jgi:hypothetical protein
LASALFAITVSYPALAETGAEQETSNPDHDTGWMDRGHDRVVLSVDKMANWADDFFGNPLSDLESSASSRIRVRPQFEWDEEDDTDWKLRATGRLNLPKINERLNLVFFSDDGDFEDEFYDPAMVANGSTTLGLQYEVEQEKHSSITAFAGMKSGFKGKLGGRYRYRQDFWERNRFTFSEALFWIGGDGFGTLTRVDIDRKLDRSLLLRWANKMEYSEESNGAEWDSHIALVKRLDDKSALRGFTFIHGETSPQLLKSRGLGFAYRHNFLRDWLYWEVEPRYAWRKEKTYEEREGVASIKLRLEILFSSE